VSVHTVDPLHDPRWAELAARHASSSIFHTPGWLRALAAAYGYEPVVYTTSAPGTPLTNGIVLCRVKSWLTGRRLVSLPFSDHCDPLVDDEATFGGLIGGLAAEERRTWKYVELRPTSGRWTDASLTVTANFLLHELDLRAGSDAVLRGAHPMVRRNIRRAARERLTLEEGRSDALLDAFYTLLILTRRRHGIFPQPRTWFRELAASLGDRFRIRLARKDGRPLASIITLEHGKTMVYKYGCSDARFHRVGAMTVLFWTAIQDAAARGLHTLDLGRSDPGNAGLATFKERWGAQRRTIAYVRMNGRGRPPLPLSLPASVLSRLPDRALAAAGRLLYRHLG
jgi:CelD/BcsL family acetyltransferase involved in cellulose biosynthesis